MCKSPKRLVQGHLNVFLFVDGKDLSLLLIKWHYSENGLNRLNRVLDRKKLDYKWRGDLTWVTNKLQKNDS